MKEKLDVTDLLKRDIPQPPVKVSDSSGGSNDQQIRSASLSPNCIDEDKKGAIFLQPDSDEGWRATFLLKHQVREEATMIKSNINPLSIYILLTL